MNNLVIVLISSLISGVIAAIISGIVNVINNNKTIKMQERVSEMQRKERLIENNRIQWLSETRKLIAELLIECSKFDVLNTKFKSYPEKLNDERERERLINDPSKIAEEYKKFSETYKELLEELTKVQSTITLLRLYFYDEDNIQHKAALKKIYEINHDININQNFPSELLDELVDIVRKILADEMKKVEGVLQ